MASGLVWFRFRVDAHSNPKIAALSDGEFRLLTYLWSLGQRSSVGGVIAVWDTSALARSSGAGSCGCVGGPDERAPAALLQGLIDGDLIEIDGDNKIRIHDWIEHNPPIPYSHTRPAKAQQKRKERKSRTDVARLSDPTRANVARTDVEVDVEKSKERTSEGAKPEKAPAIALATSPPSPLLSYLAAEFSQGKATKENEDAWAEAFPGIDLLAEAKNARRWELDNPTLIKTQKRRFLGNWFAKAQNALRKPQYQEQRHSESRPHPPAIQPAKSVEEMEAEIWAKTKPASPAR